MKRGRVSSKSGAGDASSKDEPPKKVKKRIKQAAPSTPTAATIVATPPSTPSSVVNQPSLSLPQKETKLGSLPLYGEQLPAGGYDDIPAAAKRTCAQLKEVMAKVRELKQTSTTADDEKVMLNFISVCTVQNLTNCKIIFPLTSHYQACIPYSRVIRLIRD